MHRVDYLQELYQYARSAKHKIIINVYSFPFGKEFMKKNSERLSVVTKQLCVQKYEYKGAYLHNAHSLSAKPILFIFPTLFPLLTHFSCRVFLGRHF